MARATNSGPGDGSFSFDDGDRANELAIVPDFGASGGSNDGADTGTRDGNGIDPVTGKRKRKPRSDAGKPRGSRGGAGTRKGSAVSATSVDALSRSIMMLSGFLAGVTKSPELQFDKDDADSEAKATAALLSQFDFVPDPKMQAFFDWAVITGGIVGAKIYLRGERLKEEKAAARLNQQ